MCLKVDRSEAISISPIVVGSLHLAGPADPGLESYPSMHSQERHVGVAENNDLGRIPIKKI